MICQVSVEFLFLFGYLNAAVEDEWWNSSTNLCADLDYFKGNWEDTTEQIYVCADEKAYYKTTVFSDATSCTSNPECFLNENVVAPDVCMGNTCTWIESSCWCEHIEDPFSVSSDCDQICSGTTPSPAYDSECSFCFTELGFGIFDAYRVCKCDVEFFKGANCNGSTGSGEVDSGLFAFAEESCE